MASGLSLLGLIGRLLGDPAQAAAFGDSPDGYLAEHGLGDLSAADVQDALSLGWDSVPTEVAARLDVAPDVADGATAGDALASFISDVPSIELESATDGSDLGFGLGQIDAESALDLEVADGVDSVDSSDDGLFEAVEFGGGFAVGDTGDPLADLDDVDGENQPFDDGDDLV